MPHGLKRYQNEGHLHFVTFSTHRRLPTLAHHYHLFERCLEQTRRRYNFDLHGYVLMPEHVHLLLSEPAPAPLCKALQALKLSVSKRINTHQFWQPRYYDFNVLTRAKRIEKLRYMHRNPVVRGLVTQPEDWPHSSFRHYLTGDPHPTIHLTSPHTLASNPTMTDTMSSKPNAHTPPHAHDPEEINPKVAADIAHWTKEFNVTGQVLHEAIRVHGTKIAKLRAALAKS